ncbi:MAG TPA: FhaA domain-containing protein [Pyrinomonadaceae bacterium]|nr:FhaA domain-containing protein [Pyrinomonadaceae bacterium]
MSVLDKVRHWIDGESAELVLEEAARNAQVKPRSQAEAFIVKIAKGVEEVMQNELVPLPQGTAIIPTEYIIFLSEQDDKEWQGVKRRGLEQGLYHILAERAKEIAGKKKLETQSFAVELRVDGTLEKGDIRVQHSWEEDSSNKTGVLPRPKNLPSPPSPQNIPHNQPVIQTPSFVTQPSINLNQTPATVQQTPRQQDFSFQSEDAEEMTHVQKRQSPELYRLEIWRDGVRQSVMPIYQNEISIGRGSKSQPVDVSLSGDPEISRRHLSLIFSDGSFSAVNEGRNPAVINDYELPKGQKIPVSAGVPIAVCSYVLRIQPQ